MKISLIIPTRERAQYLSECLRTAIDIQDPDLEIVVSDNDSQDDTAKVVERIDDSRIKYVKTPSRISMRGNFEYGLGQSSGDYVCFIGDDDGVIASQFPQLRAILEERRPDGLSWSVPAYSWPSGGGKGNYVKLRRRTLFGTVHDYDIGHLRQQLRGGDVKAIGWAPSVYHGIASRDYLDRTRANSGTYFNGSIPDAYFSYRSILEGGNLLRVEHPFTVAGQSRASTGAAQSSGSSSEPEKNSGVVFGNENQSDELKDVVDYALSVPLVLFSTLETVRARFPAIEFQPDYFEWYRMILSSVKGNEDALRKQVYGILSKHAESTRSQDALRAAETAREKRRGLGETVRHELSNLHTVKVGSRVGESDTIYTACTALGQVLGTEFAEVQTGAMGKNAAWKRSARRAKAL